MATSAGFRNVDLEIGARSQALLAPLLDHVAGRLSELHRGRLRGLYRMHYESMGPSSSRKRRPYDATTVIHELAGIIEALPSDARRVWDRAPLRDFNVGIEVARGAWGAEFALEADAVRRVAALGGRIVFTVYQPVPARPRAGSGRKRP